MTLRAAAQAVIDRWDTPAWKDVPATGHYINALRTALAAEQPEPVAWRDHVEQRIRTWRCSRMNEDGDVLKIDDFMGDAAVDDLVDFVCDEYAAPPQPEPLTDEQIDAGVAAWFATTTSISEHREHPFRQRMRAAIERAIK